jgi:hypothetical protein
MAATVKPDIWRRYLAMLIDGLRPARDGVTELPVAALLPEEMAAAMMADGLRARSAQL